MASRNSFNVWGSSRQFVGKGHVKSFNPILCIVVNVIIENIETSPWMLLGYLEYGTACKVLVQANWLPKETGKDILEYAAHFAVGLLYSQ